MVGGLALAGGVAMTLAARTPPPLPVHVEAPRTGDLESTLFVRARVVNERVVTVSALTDGTVAEILVADGARVEAGQPLVRFDERAARLNLERTRAEAAFRVERLAIARRAHQRDRRLGRSHVSAERLEDGRSSLAGETALHAAADAAVRLAELELERLTIRAPFDGVVSARSVERGQHVGAATPLFTLLAEGGRRIEARVDHSDFPRVHLGQPARISLAGAPEAPWSSRVSWIAPALDASDGRTFAIRLPPGDDAPPMLPGQPLDVALVLERREQVLSLPLHALEEGAAGGWSVWLEDGALARRRPVELGLVTLDRAEIVDGLDAGATVLLAPPGALQDGRPVRALR